MTTIFQLTRDDIINAAYRKIGVLSEGTSANTSQLSTGTQALNAIVATFQSLGMPLWARKELAISMVVGQRDYSIGVEQAIAVPFPLHVYEAKLTVNTDIEMMILARQDFNRLPPLSTGTPVNVSYQPFINYGVLSVWPTPNSVNTLTITYQAPFDYFDSGTDTPDFPQEWSNALIYALAVSLAPEHGLPINDRTDLKQDARMHLETALSNGTEDGSIFFGKAWHGI